MVFADDRGHLYAGTDPEKVDCSGQPERSRILFALIPGVPGFTGDRYGNQTGGMDTFRLECC